MQAMAAMSVHVASSLLCGRYLIALLRMLQSLVVAAVGDLRTMNALMVMVVVAVDRDLGGDAVADVARTDVGDDDDDAAVMTAGDQLLMHIRHFLI